MVSRKGRRGVFGRDRLYGERLTFYRGEEEEKRSSGERKEGRVTSRKEKDPFGFGRSRLSLGGGCVEGGLSRRRELSLKEGERFGRNKQN